MTGRERRLITALKRLHSQCVTSVPNAIPGLPASFARNTVKLGGLLTEAEAAATTLSSSGPFGLARARRDLLVNRLRDEFLTPARKIARMHAATVPGFHTAFVVPKLRSAVQTTVDVARRFADAAEPSVALFLEEGLDDDFLQQIRTLADQIEAKHREAEQHRADRTQTAKAFRSLIREARRTAWLLDAAVRRRCAELEYSSADPSASSPRPKDFSPATAIANWEHIFHVERDPVRKARRLKVQF
ncbi:MAG TPA: hypothetical protein VNU46_07435 [Gemmatimonadaceae bacterium]|jgi:hypothetical protein|nr:hypothetical protein [Gemmatimonadaceae bacterium]